MLSAQIGMSIGCVQLFLKEHKLFRRVSNALKPTLTGTNKQMRIDYILCSADFLQNDHIRPVSFANHLEHQKYGSDHSPISTTLRLAESTDTTVTDIVHTMIAHVTG